MEEIKVGKLITISFVSGLMISTLLSKTIINSNFRNFEKDAEFDTNNQEDFPDQSIEEKNISNNEIPPQRDIRDTQPTISVNYRIVKNTKDGNPKSVVNSSNDKEYNDDWIKKDTEW